MTTTTTSVSDVETHMEWRLSAAACTKTEGNPFELNETVLDRTIKSAPPLHETAIWKKVIPCDVWTYQGRHLIHDTFVRYDNSDQPREKSNEVEQVNELINDFEVYGYREDAQPPICVPDTTSNDSSDLKGLSGYHRKAARNNLAIKQKVYFYDVYTFDSPYWEVVARNVTNHHGNPQLKQKWTDYRSEAVNAVTANIIPRDEDAISTFVELIAADKPSNVRKKIKANAFKECGVYPNFRTYNSKGSGTGTIQEFVCTELGLPKMGFEGRTENDAQAIKDQGYILYASDRGDALRAWGSGINKAMRWGIPTWIFGYSNRRIDDLIAWREEFIEEFEDFKENQILFAHSVAQAWVDDECIDEYDSLSVDELVSSVDERSFPIKLAGFFPQHTSRNVNDGGRPTECGLVDVYGKTIKFNPDGECLTLSQP